MVVFKNMTHEIIYTVFIKMKNGNKIKIFKSSNVFNIKSKCFVLLHIFHLSEEHLLFTNNTSNLQYIN